ncbi:MAG TPA: SRPBCC family protein [Alphaproteobacteria bacterium]|nr:SRPBCC family protein [Alphaproteobacteria bacterium]
MSIGKIISLILALAVIGFMALAASKPDEFRVERSLVINAPTTKIFAQVNDLEQSQQWSPWVEMDPEATYEFEGPKAGEGATIHWEGEKSGKGSMIITESTPEKVIFRLEFLKPMQATNTAEFAFSPAPEGQEGTLVTWRMYGPNNFIGKMMSVVMDCEAMVGEQFEKGLSNLKGRVEQK